MKNLKNKIKDFELRVIYLCKQNYTSLELGRDKNAKYVRMLWS